MNRSIARLALPWVNGAQQQWYHRPDFIMEMRLFRRWAMRSGEVHHFLFGENSYRYLGLIRRLLPVNRLVATFHTPPDRFREVVGHHEHLAHLDAAIIMSTSQLECFSPWLPENRIWFIPHGIDTEYYQPLHTSLEMITKKFICVGGHLRDFTTLRSVAEILQERAPEVRIVIVGAGDYAELFKQMRNIEIKTGVDDIELRSLYQHSIALLMPLQNATANNAILEALACGLPIITTELIGTQDYLRGTGAMLVPSGDVRGFSDAALALLKSPALRKSMSRRSRCKAETFSWKRITDDTLAVYESLWS